MSGLWIYGLAKMDINLHIVCTSVKTKQNAFSFRVRTPWPEDQELCPLTPLGALPKTARYRLSLHARHNYEPPRLSGSSRISIGRDASGMFGSSIENFIVMIVGWIQHQCMMGSGRLVKPMRDRDGRVLRCLTFYRVQRRINRRPQFGRWISGSHWQASQSGELNANASRHYHISHLVDMRTATAAALCSERDSQSSITPNLHRPTPNRRSSTVSSHRRWAVWIWHDSRCKKPVLDQNRLFIPTHDSYCCNYLS